MNKGTSCSREGLNQEKESKPPKLCEMMENSSKRWSWMEKNELLTIKIKFPWVQ